MKRIVLTGGGTAGHVTPHLSLIPRLREAGYDIHYIGTENGIEQHGWQREECGHAAVSDIVARACSSRSQPSAGGRPSRSHVPL